MSRRAFLPFWLPLARYWPVSGLAEIEAGILATILPTAIPLAVAIGIQIPVTVTEDPNPGNAVAAPIASDRTIPYPAEIGIAAICLATIRNAKNPDAFYGILCYINDTLKAKPTVR